MSNARFSVIQATAVDDKRLSNSQFRTLAALGKYGDKEGWCFPKLATIGTDLGKSKQAVSKDIQALVELGYVEVHKQFRKDGSQTNNLYRLIFDQPRQSDIDPHQRDDDPPSTPEIDPPSTPEVDALTPHVNAPPEGKEGEGAPPEIPDFPSMELNQALEIKEIEVYRVLCHRIPGRVQWGLIYKYARAVVEKHTLKNRQELYDYLKPYWEEWVSRDYRPGNLGWLKDWALDGEIPSYSKNGKKKPEVEIDPEKEAEEEAALEVERVRVRKLFSDAGLVPAQEEANVNQS